MHPKTALVAAGIGVGIVVLLGYIIGHGAVKMANQMRTTSLADHLGD